MDTKLCKMMPATLAIEDNMSGEWRTPYGFVFPPFVIIERGQSLDEWARDNNPDFITIFQVCVFCSFGHCFPFLGLVTRNQLRYPVLYKIANKAHMLTCFGLYPIPLICI